MDPSTLVPWLTLCIGVVGIVAITGLRRGSLLSPASVTLVMLVAIFGVRPIMMVSRDNYRFYGGTNILDGYAVAAYVGLVSVTAFLLGYLVSASGRNRTVVADAPARLVEVPRPLNVGLAGRTSLGVLILWLALMILAGGGVSYLGVLFQGRGAGGEAALAGLPAIIPALPVVAALLVALARIETERIRPLTVREKCWYWLVLVLAVIPPTALGSRRFLLPSLLAALIAAMGTRWSKIVTLRMIVLAFASFLALSVIPFVRSSGSRTGSPGLLGAMRDYFGERGIGGTLENFFLSYDTEMFNYVAFLATRLGDSIEYGWGRGTIGEALVSVIPAGISPYPRWSNVILIEAFGGACGVSYCPVPSASGVLFYDLGLAGVFVGMCLLGALSARFEANFIASNGSKLVILLTLASFTPQIIRGNSIAQLWIAIQIIVVVGLLVWFLRRVSARSGEFSGGRVETLIGTQLVGRTQK